MIRLKQRKIRPNQQKNKDQATLNSLLWRIVMNQGGKITLSYDNIKNIPAESGLKVDNIPGTDNIRIKAVIKSPITTQDRRIIV